jgi:hypothetical protein
LEVLEGIGGFLGILTSTVGLLVLPFSSQAFLSYLVNAMMSSPNNSESSTKLEIKSYEICAMACCNKKCLKCKKFEDIREA